MKQKQYQIVQAKRNPKALSVLADKWSDVSDGLDGSAAQPTTPEIGSRLS